MSPEELLDAVVDRDTFLAFARELAAERFEAEEMGRAEPDVHRYGAPLGWQNGEISAFLDAALRYFEPGPHRTPEDAPSWRMFAEFLYFGKIYE